jgi:hypothetical protein
VTTSNSSFRFFPFPSFVRSWCRVCVCVCVCVQCRQIFNNILMGNVVWPSDDDADTDTPPVSANAKHLVAALLVRTSAFVCVRRASIRQLSVTMTLFGCDVDRSIGRSFDRSGA